MEPVNHAPVENLVEVKKEVVEAPRERAASPLLLDVSPAVAVPELRTPSKHTTYSIQNILCRDVKLEPVSPTNDATTCLRNVSAPAVAESSRAADPPPTLPPPVVAAISVPEAVPHRPDPDFEQITIRMVSVY